MDSGFASTMSTAVETLSSGFSSFTGSTLVAGIWEGEAADNAKNQVSEKIDTKIEEIQEKLKNLITAIDKGNEAITAKSNMEEAQRCIEEVKASDAPMGQKNADIKHFQEDYEKYKKQFDDLVEEVKSLCSE